jgi:hypothetical protein
MRAHNLLFNPKREKSENRTEKLKDYFGPERYLTVRHADIVLTGKRRNLDLKLSNEYLSWVTHRLKTQNITVPVPDVSSLPQCITI